jgi:hypothetical protein
MALQRARHAEGSRMPVVEHAEPGGMLRQMAQLEGCCAGCCAASQAPSALVASPAQAAAQGEVAVAPVAVQT